ncbi:hypothetical protein [Lentzea flava]|uniref:Uncharacterized protein n=1 Tax=Lentzea flava TaxID=103732 RepID=A0ABQ2V0V3_9PSEU|nr:hypothetical protein [Lentzea flava]MCP2202715.1 hypothetical protein [Lentzea flava]GGU61712.1 hypothetical protein GCM10010178_62360 [Lentzea flava]
MREVPDEQRCAARSTTNNGARCRKPKTPGTSVCASHGSAAPQVRRRAAERVAVQAAEADAAAILAHAGLSGVADPYEALSRVAAELLAHKDAWAQRVNALDAITSQSPLGAESIRVEIELYGRSMIAAARTLEVLAKLQLDDRRVRVSEAIGQQVASVIKLILTELQLSDEQQAAAPAVVSRALLTLVPAS